MRKYLMAVLAVMLLIAGCGGGTKTVTKTVTTQAPTASLAAPKTPASVTCDPSTGPPAGEGFMGACAPKPLQVYPGGKSFPTLVNVPGCKFPDVSSWQGAVNWSPIKNWERSHGCPGAGIFKMGEFVVDPFASHNASELHRLGMFAAGYWFVRNTGCSHESARIINEARLVNVKVVVLDMEVPEALGYAHCLSAPVKAAGFTVVIYTAPGTWPGGSGDRLPTWIAAYGPSIPPASPFGGRLVAFQCTDGIFGCVTPVPGLGNIDVSVDLGITKLGAPVDPLGYLDKTRRHFHTKHGVVVASEYNTVKAYRRAKCRKPERRTVCKSSVYHDRLLEGRLFAVSQHKHPHFADGRGRRLHTLRVIDVGH